MKLKGYKSVTTAEKKAKELGCEGTHKHGEVFMPCKSHKQYVSKSKEPKKELDELIEYTGDFLGEVYVNFTQIYAFLLWPIA